MFVIEGLDFSGFFWICLVNYNFGVLNELVLFLMYMFLFNKENNY